MAKGTLNKVILIGRLGANPETRYMPSGSAVTNLRLATNEVYKDKTSGQTQESTEWHRVVLFGRLAEIAAQYLQKGRVVYIEGRLRTNKWQDNAGQERYTTEIVANEMQLLGGGGAREDGADMPAAAPAMAASGSKKPASMPADTMPSIEDDEIPF